MSQPTDASFGPQANPPRGRYRFQGSLPLEPDAGLHPEMVGDQAAAPVVGGIPSSPNDLIAMQTTRPDRPEKPDRQPSPKTREVLALLEQLDTSAAEDQQISLFLVRRLETFHDQVVADMKDDEDAPHSQIVSWTIDADRLYRARMLLESVDLE
jgi:hypothetical protein